MIWLVGDRGMLGRELTGVLAETGLKFSGSDRELDITEADAVTSRIRELDPQVIINCAAYTAVDNAEEDMEAAEGLNVRGPVNLAHGALASGARLIQISTDYVFAGTSDKPLEEDEPTAPIGVYGRTKRDGEMAIIKIGCRYDIVRTAWLYGQYGPNFVTTMVRLMNERDSLKVVDDQVGSPTWAYDLAQFLTFLAGNPDRDSDIFHFSNEGRISWYEFARAIHQEGVARGLVNSEVAIAPCGSDEYPTKASRPSYSLLSKRKIRDQFNREIPDWRDSLRQYMDIIGDTYE